LIESKTRDEVANETGVSPRTIARDAAYAEAGKRNMAVIGKAKNQVAKVAT
jgi:predicted DNA-binding transcriptional regulator YafY